MGFLGILEPRNADHVPGTVILDEHDPHSEGITGALKHAKGSKGAIVLVPQPSKDPNDPLNWSKAKKFSVLCIISLGVILCAATNSVLLNAGLVVIAKDMHVTIPQMAQLSGYMLLVGGASGPFICAFARKYAKRPCFVISSCLALIGTIIGATSSDYKVHTGARVVQGLAVISYEALSVSVIGDMYFVHERGMYNSGLQFVLNSVPNLVSVVTGSVTNNLGWKYLFYLQIVFIGCQTILVFFFCPETTYVRDQRLNLDEVIPSEVRKEEVGKSSDVTTETQMLHLEETAATIPPVKSFRQQLAVFTGTYSDENIFLLIASPFLACVNVAGLWVLVMGGSLSAFYVAVNFVLAQIFSSPPYNLTPEGVGLLSFGPFIGSIIACALLGYLMD